MILNNREQAGKTLTGVGAVLGPAKADVASKLDMVLGVMESRGSINLSTVISAKATSIAIGSCSHPGEESAVNPIEKTTLVADGTLPSSLRLEESDGPVEHHIMIEAIRGSGPLSCLAISKGGLLALRDVLGQKPLYYGKDRSGVVAFASLRSALDEIGISSSKPATPGLLVEMTVRQQRVVSNETLSMPPQKNVSEQEAVRQLGKMLVESLADETLGETALAFSGGLDSTLVAHAASENGLRPELITVGVKGQVELDHAQRVSKSLGLDLTLHELSREDIVASLADVVETVESIDPVVVGVSVPLFFACEAAQEMGMKHLLAGQLSDELFGGYGRFDRLASSSEPGDVTKEIWRSVLAASGNDFEPGDKLAVSHRLELKCPFAFLPLVEYALRLPVSLKLRMVGGQVVRKFILRRLASSWKLPDTVVERPKKAVQYSSGVQKVLLKEAKKRHTTLGNWLKSFR